MPPQPTDYHTQPLISEPQIAQRVRELANQLVSEYRDRNPLVVGVLKGAFVFLSDLIREMGIPLEVDFVRLSSYRGSTYPTSKPQLLLDLSIPAIGRHVLIVDDIADTGHSLAFLRERFVAAGAASVRMCTLLDKPARREVPVSLDYVGFEIPDVFVVGYGIDVAERYRHLREIRAVEAE